MYLIGDEMTKNDGGPIHPPSIAVGPAGDVYFSDDYARNGMCLRDWFAGQALAALVATTRGQVDGIEHKLAREAYIAADAMLKARADGDG